MEELTYSLLENGTIQKKDRKYIVDKKISNIPVPDTIQGIIAARIDRLEENLKRTMQVASVIGREFAFRILQTISGMREEIKSYLLNLQGLELIYEKSLFPELEYIFKHALTQEVAYNSLLLARRKEIHEKIGNAIEELYPHRLEEFYEMLAYHYSRSDNNNKAYHYLKLSGDKTRAGYANWEALRFYGEAIDILDQMPSTEANRREGIEARLSLAMPAMLLSYPEDTINVLKEGINLANEVRNIRSLAKLNGTLAHAYAAKGQSNLAIEHAEQCFQEAQEIQDLDLMAPVARELTSAYMYAGEFLKAVPIFSTVIPLIEKANKRSDSFGRPASVYTFLCGLAGFIMGTLGSFTEAEDLCKKAHVNAVQNNNLYELAYSEYSFGVVAMTKGHGKSSVEYLQKCIEHLQQCQMTLLLDSALVSLGSAYVNQGDLDKAREFADRALAAISQPGAASGFALITQSLLAIVYSEVGEYEKAHSCANKAVRLSRESMARGWEGWACLTLGNVLARMEEKRFEEAENLIERALTMLDEYKLRPWFTIAVFFLGEIYAKFGNWEKSQESLKKAEAMFKDMGMDYWLARTYTIYAEMFKSKGDILMAKENLERAINIFKECGSDGWLQKYEKELAGL
jgi:tetratricopeptide (TPR) repeat protein